MRTSSIGMIVMVSLLACSCVPLPSFFPLWDAGHDAFDPHLAGTWRGTDGEDEDTLTISEASEKTYSVSIREKEAKTGKIKQSHYRARMVRLGDRTFLDFEMDDAALTKTFEAEIFPSVVDMHFFGRAELDGDNLKLALLDDERFEKKVAAGRIDLQLPHRKDTVILVSETSKIQQALTTLADDKELGPMP